MAFAFINRFPTFWARVLPLLFGSILPAIGATITGDGSGTQTCQWTGPSLMPPLTQSQNGTTISFGQCGAGYFGPTANASITGLVANGQIGPPYLGNASVVLKGSLTDSMLAAGGTGSALVEFSFNFNWAEADDQNASFFTTADLNLNGSQIWKGTSTLGNFPLTTHSNTVVVDALVPYGVPFVYSQDISLTGSGNGIAFGSGSVDPASVHLLTQGTLVAASPVPEPALVWPLAAALTIGVVRGVRRRRLHPGRFISACPQSRVKRG